MAFRTWAKLLGATLGVAALAGACQLGVAYGLGILRLTRVLDVPTRDQWTAQLAWVAWFTMMAAVLGALAGGWLLERWRGSATVTTHIAMSLAAGVGAALVVPLTMQPARTAQVAGVHPVFVIGLCAGLGALVGAFAAYAALTQRVARWSLSIFGLVVWVIANVAVIAVLPLLNSRFSNVQPASVAACASLGSMAAPAPRASPLKTKVLPIRELIAFSPARRVAAHTYRSV